MKSNTNAGKPLPTLVFFEIQRVTAGYVSIKRYRMRKIINIYVNLCHLFHNYFNLFKSTYFISHRLALLDLLAISIQ